MDENKRRRLSLAQELTTWASTMPNLMKRIDEALRTSELNAAQSRDIKLTGEYVENLFKTIGNLLDADGGDLSYDRLMSLTDRLREELLMAHAKLDSVFPVNLLGN